MKAPVRATRRIPSRTKNRIPPHYRAHKEVSHSKSSNFCGHVMFKTWRKLCHGMIFNVTVGQIFPSGLCSGLRPLKKRVIWSQSVTLTSPAGWSCWDEECRLPGQSAQFSQTGPAPTGELRGFPAVKKQQTESHHSAGNQRCCHTCTTEDSYESCCMKRWTLS